MKTEQNIFDRLLDGELISFEDKDYYRIRDACNATRKWLVKLNTESNANIIRDILGKIVGSEINESTMVYPPFHVNYGKNIKIGKNVFINFDCTFLDLGGITIEDDVLIAPKVSLLSEGHPVEGVNRQTLKVGKIHIKRNAWIGANATILQGVTIGENAIIAAGSVVSSNVPKDTIYAGIPAKEIKKLK